MGEDKILDPPDNPEMMNKRLDRKYGLLSFFLISFCIALIFSACRLPRIIVLDDPLTPEEHLNLGVAYEKNNELDPAIKEYKLAAEKLPLAYLYLGNTYFQKNELDEAEKYFKMAVEKLPGNADARNNLAWLYYTKKTNLAEAESLALKAIELNPAKESIFRDTLEKIRALNPR